MRLHAWLAWGGSDWSVRGDGAEDVGSLYRWHGSLLLTLLLPAEGGRRGAGARCTRVPDGSHSPGVSIPH